MRTRLAILSLVAVFLGSASGSTASAVRVCQSRVDRGVLPVWARSGFSARAPRLAHVVGRSARIAALLFGPRLSSPPGAGVSNKILWVARIPLSAPSDLRISAQRMAGRRLLGKPVARSVQGGPGPSSIDLPAAGCWRMTLHWAGRADTLDLVYQRPAGS
jgi:hypothetical protein